MNSCVNNAFDAVYDTQYRLIIARRLHKANNGQGDTKQMTVHLEATPTAAVAGYQRLSSESQQPLFTGQRRYDRCRNSTF
jgi:hypothetical protein